MGKFWRGYSLKRIFEKRREELDFILSVSVFHNKFPRNKRDCLENRNDVPSLWDWNYNGIQHKYEKKSETFIYNNE